jgi:peroxiredoxin
MTPRLLPSLLILLFLAAAVLVLAAPPEHQGLAPVPNRPAAPAIDLEGSDGHRVRLADFAGRPVIVNFWATWCPPCRAEMPSLQRAWEALKKDGIGVIGVNVGEDSETVSQFSMEHSLTFPLALDEDSAVLQRWPITGLPTTFVVDPKGRLAYMALGERDWDDPGILEQVRALKAPRQAAAD